MTNGAAFLKQRLERAREHGAAGGACMVVFDIDNTLVDTRARTLCVARRYDEEHGTRHFAGLRIDRVGWDAVSTCAGLGLDEPDCERFGSYWEQEFWNPARFEHDVPIEVTIGWATRAHEAGVRVVLLTGRIEALREATVVQVHRAGLGFVGPSDVHMKPALGASTNAFKASKLAQMMSHGFVGWYITESRTEISYLQSRLRTAPCVLLGGAPGPQRPVLAPGTPVLTGGFESG